MSNKDRSDFREIWTHDSAVALIKDTLRRFGTELGAEVEEHIYDSNKPDGTIKVKVARNNTFQIIRYGLPDDRDELRQMAIAALEPHSVWKNV